MSKRLKGMNKLTLLWKETPQGGIRCGFTACGPAATKLEIEFVEKLMLGLRTLIIETSKEVAGEEGEDVIPLTMTTWKNAKGPKKQGR